MLFYQIVALFNLMTCGLMYMIIMTKYNTSKVHKTFCYFAFSVFLWAFCYFFWQISTNSQIALFWCRALMVGAIFIPSTYFHFSVHVIEQYEKYKHYVKWSYFASLILLILNFTPLFVYDVRPRLIFPYWPTAGITFASYIALYVFEPTFALFLLIKNLDKMEPYTRKRFKYLYWGTLIGLAGSLTNFPLWYDIPILPWTNGLVSVYFFLVTYSIVRYQLFDVRIAINRSLVYTVLVTTVTLIYFMSIYALERLFQDFVGYSSFLASLTSATAIAISFIPLRNTIQVFIDTYFFKGSVTQIVQENEMLRREVAQAEKSKAIATLASGMAHEIKNPLTAIKTFAAHLPEKRSDVAFVEQFSTIVGKEVNRIDDLVHQLLEFSRPAALDIKEAEIHNIIEELLSLLRNQLKDKNISVKKDFVRKTVYINLDESRIKQVFLNVLLNGIDAMLSGGELTIKTRIHLDRLELTFMDEGVGILKEDIYQIFDPFFTRKDNGTGLGLAIAKGIIQEHKGTILVKSEVGVGTSFIIDLPLN